MRSEIAATGSGRPNYTVEGLIVLLGAALLIAGYTIGDGSILRELLVDEALKLLGTLLVGLGFGGVYEKYHLQKSERSQLRLLETHLEQYPRLTRQLFLDHLETGEHNLDVPDKYRTTLVLYHQTGASIDDEDRTVWVKERYDFSRELTKRIIYTKSRMDDPREGMPQQIYAVQLTIQRGKILISMINETDQSEPACVHLLDVPLLSGHSCGITHHMDWEGRGRVSRAIFFFGDPEHDPRRDAAKLDDLWERGGQAKFVTTLRERAWAADPSA
ncbi:MAG: hypothetical protein GW855_13090 [Erythrobacter sp.]|nr:hypothetical protein [Erythrobacter sp.]NCQ64998.1 hypothetical protein [Alphaproteobacteria bacterium]